MIQITGKSLGPGPRAVLIEIMKSAGVESCEVTSVGRTPATQARIMYENLIGTDVGQGVTAQMALYRPPGQAVIQVYVENSAKPKDEIISLMLAEIWKQGPEKVSHHCSMIRWVFDVGPSSIAEDKRQSFLLAAQHHPKVVKLLSPFTEPKDPAYHLEIPKEIET